MPWDVLTEPLTLAMLAVSALAGLLGYLTAGPRTAAAYAVGTLVAQLLTHWFVSSVRDYASQGRR